MRRAFTMIELLAALLILGVVTALATMTFNAIVSSWTVSTEYMDNLQRCDYALEQVVSGLRSMYYPHNGKQDYTYGFYLTDNGDGREADDSDVIEWAKTGQSIVGGQNAAADTVHRVQLMVLEEGNSDYKETIPVTGLYARMCPDPALRPKRDKKVDETDYTFANDEMYQPVLFADGIVGFNCRVMKNADSAGEDGKGDEIEWEDEWDSSNSVPYKVELTFWLEDPREEKRFRSELAPVMRIVKIPIFEQSQDGKALPSENAKGGARRGSSKGGTRGGGADAGGGAGGGRGGAGAGPAVAPGGPGGGAGGGGR